MANVQLNDHPLFHDQQKWLYALLRCSPIKLSKDDIQFSIGENGGQITWKTKSAEGTALQTIEHVESSQDGLAGVVRTLDTARVVCGLYEARIDLRHSNEQNDWTLSVIVPTTQTIGVARRPVTLQDVQAFAEKMTKDKNVSFKVKELKNANGAAPYIAVDFSLSPQLLALSDSKWRTSAIEQRVTDANRKLY